MVEHTDEGRSGRTDKYPQRQAASAGAEITNRRGIRMSIRMFIRMCIRTPFPTV